MTPKQKRFAMEYVKNGGNGAKAARDAGYSSACDGSKQRAHENVTNHDVKGLINDLTIKALTAKELTPEHVIEGLMKESGLDGAGGVKDSQQGGRIRALELCGKALPGGLFTDRTTSETPVLSGLELVIKLAQDGCPNMAVGAAVDLQLVNFETEKALKLVSLEAAKLLVERIPDVACKVAAIEHDKKSTQAK